MIFSTSEDISVGEKKCLCNRPRTMRMTWMRKNVAPAIFYSQRRMQKGLQVGFGNDGRNQVSSAPLCPCTIWKMWLFGSALCRSPLQSSLEKSHVQPFKTLLNQSRLEKYERERAWTGANCQWPRFRHIDYGGNCPCIENPNFIPVATIAFIGERASRDVWRHLWHLIAEIHFSSFGNCWI